MTNKQAFEILSQEREFANLTGFSSEESLFLFSAHPNLNFVGILASSMIIGALGAVMDIGMSIASTVNELYISNDYSDFQLVLFLDIKSVNLYDHKVTYVFYLLLKNFKYANMKVGKLCLEIDQFNSVFRKL